MLPFARRHLVNQTAQRPVETRCESRAERPKPCRGDGLPDVVFPVDSTVLDQLWAVVHAVLLLGIYSNALLFRVYLGSVLEAVDFQKVVLQVDIASR